jgi:hypothetical protein
MGKMLEPGKGVGAMIEGTGTGMGLTLVGCWGGGPQLVISPTMLDKKMTVPDFPTRLLM